MAVNGQYIRRLDTIIKHFPDPFEFLDPEDGDCEEAETIAVARLAADCLKECVKQESEIRRSMGKSSRQLHHLDTLILDKSLIIKEAKRELGLDKAEDELEKIQYIIDAKKRELKELEKQKKQFDRCNVANLMGEFVAGGIEKVQECLALKKAAGIHVSAILFPLEQMSNMFSGFFNQPHINGIPIHYSSALKRDMFILFSPNNRPMRHYQ
jgi:hypothetical protein